MTNELLDKANELKKEIYDVECVAYYLNTYFFHLQVKDRQKSKIQRTW